MFGNNSYIPSQTNCWSQAEFYPNLNNFTSTNTTSTWCQTPPSNVPWGISYTQNLPNVVRFTGQSDISFPYQTSISSSPFGNTFPSKSKRRLDNDLDYSEPPNKQLITEEKMAAKMNDMHISSSYISHNQNLSSESQTSGSISSVFSVSNNNNSCFDDMNNISNNNDSKMPSLYIIDDLKHRLPVIEPCIPPSLLHRTLSSKALVLWKPRPGCVDFEDSKSYIKTSSSNHNSSNATYISSDDPNCTVSITEIVEDEEQTQNELDEMDMDL